MCVSVYVQKIHALIRSLSSASVHQSHTSVFRRHSGNTTDAGYVTPAVGLSVDVTDALCVGDKWRLHFVVSTPAMSLHSLATSGPRWARELIKPSRALCIQLPLLPFCVFLDRLYLFFLCYKTGANELELQEQCFAPLSKRRDADFFPGMGFVHYTGKELA